MRQNVMNGNKGKSADRLHRIRVFLPCHIELDNDMKMCLTYIPSHEVWPASTSWAYHQIVLTNMTFVV